MNLGDLALHNIGNVGLAGIKLNNAVPVFFSDSEPSTDVVGAIWVDTLDTLDGEIYVGSKRPNAEGDFWLPSGMDGESILINSESITFAFESGDSPWDVYNDDILQISLSRPDFALIKGATIWNDYNSYYWDGNEWVKQTGGDLKLPLYTLGAESELFVEGFSRGNGSQSKEFDHLYIYGRDTSGFGERSYVTDNVIDLSGYSKIFIDWENTGDENTSNNSTLIADSLQSFAFNGSVSAKLQKQESFNRIVDELDVSSLSGDYYIGVNAADSAASGVTSELQVYRIWLE